MAGAPARGARRARAPAKVDDFQLADQDYLAHQLSRLKDAKAVVLVSYDSRSAAAQRAAPQVMALKAAWAAKGVEMFLIDSTLGDARPQVARAMKAAGYDLRVLFDYEQLGGRAAGPDAHRRGGGDQSARLDGGLPQARWPAPARRWRRWPWGQPVAVAHAPAAGDPIAFPERGKAEAFQRISYAKTIAPIVQEKCTGCHQPGGIGPMTLTSYEQIKGFSPMIREVLRTKRMPPYLADETVGHFTDDDRLSPDQIKTLVHWIEAGSPRGPGADPLAKIAFKAPEWPLGKPDVIVNVPAVDIASTGVMEYQRPVVKNVMTEGRWMKATTFRVSDRKVVHHILTGTVEGDGGATKTATGDRMGRLAGRLRPGPRLQHLAQGHGDLGSAFGRDRVPEPLHALW